MYATVLQLIHAFGVVETARVCDGDSEPFLVTADLFLKAAKGEPLGDATTEEQAAAQAAVAKAEDGLVRASRRMDSYLGQATALPLLQPLIDANALSGICLNIGRYILHDDRATEEMRNRYKDDVEWLKAIASGKARLVGAEGGAVASASSSIRHGQARSNFDWNAY